MLRHEDKTTFLHEDKIVRAGLDYLCAHDDVFAPYADDIQSFGWRVTGAGFSGLVRIVIGQQVSTAAAASLWRRFTEAVPDVTPENIQPLDTEYLRTLGLSRQKAAYIQNLAAQVAEGRFDPEALAIRSDAAVYEAITALKGLGRWSAEMFLMFGLARPDIWPAGDLGVQEGMRRYLGADTRPNAEEMIVHGERFAGRRTAAALLLWHMKAQPSLGA